MDLQSITITLPKSILIELANNGIESGRGSGNLSGYLEASAGATLGLFTDPALAYEYLMRLVRVDIMHKKTVGEVADALEDTARMLRSQE